MTMEDEKKDTLIRYRLEQAKEAIDDAAFLFDNNRGLRSVVNRIYYAMFYAVLALLVREPFQGSKHSGVIGYFNKRFMKEGIFPPEIGKYLNLAFEARQESDYKEFSELTTENVEELLKHAKAFTEEVRTYKWDFYSRAFTMKGRPLLMSGITTEPKTGIALAGLTPA